MVILCPFAFAFFSGSTGENYIAPGRHVIFQRRLSLCYIFELDNQNLCKRGRIYYTLSTYLYLNSANFDVYAVPRNGLEYVQLVALDVKAEKVNAGPVERQQNGEKRHAEHVVSLCGNSRFDVDL
jgi:hypothetical protein